MCGVEIFFHRDGAKIRYDYVVELEIRALLLPDLGVCFILGRRE